VESPASTDVSWVTVKTKTRSKKSSNVLTRTVDSPARITHPLRLILGKSDIEFDVRSSKIASVDPGWIQ
jgi:hypothetical protein